MDIIVARKALSLFIRLRYNSRVSNAWNPDINGHGTEKPNSARLKGGNAVVVGACFIAAVKMAQDRSWDKMVHSPKITATISTALTIAKKIYDRAVAAYPELF